MRAGPFFLYAEHPDSLHAIDVATAYGEMLADADLGPVVASWDSSLSGRDLVPGSLSDLLGRLKRASEGAFRLKTSRGHLFVLSKGVGGRPVWSMHDDGTEPPIEWLAAAGRFAEALARNRLAHSTVSIRREDTGLDFVPTPPIARHNHAIETDEASVAAAYENPALFWRQWDQVHKIGAKRLCIRALDAVELPNWLARTFAGTMDLARDARPNLTEHGAPRKKWDPQLRAFWEPGPYSEEKAGMPALSLVRYDAATKTLQYSGFIDKSDEHGHVLAKELSDLWTVFFDDADDQGRPVAAVHVTFLDEWMARQERRPLRDIGARVFYLNKSGTAVEITD